MSAIATLSTGTILDRRYRIIRELGQGGFGRTYLAANERRKDEKCVLKEFLPQTTKSAAIAKSRELFQREADVLYKLNHPQIPKFIDGFEENSSLFLVQEFVEGKTYWQLLQERQTRGETFSEAEVVDWMQALLPVLTYIHNRDPKVIHRDIAPDNIMLPNDGGLPVLIDFGVVKQAMTEVSGNCGGGSFVGKIGYSAPEQLRMGQCYESSDLYSLAVTALVLLTGKPPNELFDSQEMCWQWRDAVKVSDRLGQIFDKMLAEKPDDRYSCAAAVQTELATLEIPASECTSLPDPQVSATKCNKNKLPPTLPSQPEPSLPPTKPEETQLEPPSQRPRWHWIAAVGTCVVLLLGGSVLTVKAPHIAAICKPLGNCARDKEFQAVYEEAVKGGEAAQALSGAVQNLEDLQGIRDRYHTTVTRLETVPDDVEVYDLAQEKLTQYRSERQQTEDRITQEQEASQHLEKAQEMAQKVTEQTEAATSIGALEEAKVQWGKVQGQLGAIASERFVTPQVKELRTESDQQVKAINDKIAKLQAEAEARRRAEEKRRQEAAAAEAARRRSSPSSGSSSGGGSASSSSGSRSQSSSTSRSSSSKSSRSSSPTAPRPAAPKPASEPLWGNSAPSKPASEPLW